MVKTAPSDRTIGTCSVELVLVGVVCGTEGGWSNGNDDGAGNGDGAGDDDGEVEDEGESTIA